MPGTRNNPWQITNVVVGQNGDLHFYGRNHYRDGERFTWGLDNFGCLPEFHKKRYTFHGCAWESGARERFASMVRRNKKKRTAGE